MAATEALPAADAVARDWVAPVHWDVLIPAPRISLSEWADQHRVLSRVASAEPGRWMTARAEYQRGIMDAISDPTVRTVVFMKSAQVGATEILCNTVGYYMDQDPAPILVVQPNLDMAKAWSTDRLKPMLQESRTLRGKVAESGRRHSGDAMLHKEFPGGHLTIVGANSAAGLASRPIRVVLLDEVDRYPDSAGDEGDPVNLAVKRTQTFHTAKVVLTSTPTIKGLSRIEAAWHESDQRRYLVPCPHCGGEQILEWKHMRWTDYNPDTAHYVCPLCGSTLTEAEKDRAVMAGRWEAQRPGADVVGFHINALYSPWARWAGLVKEWLAAQQSLTMLQVFVNTTLGETWEERGGGLNPDALMARKTQYPTLSAGIGVITMGVDVQQDRLETVTRGWGAGEQSWLLGVDVLPGDPGQPGVWRRLDELRARTWTSPAGRTVRVNATGVDTGHNTDAVYAYVKPRQAQGVYALKGSSTPGKSLLPRKPSVNNKARVRLYEIGTDAAKDLIYSRLRQTEPGPGTYHIPDWTPETWFDQITAERPLRKLVNGRWVRRYELPPGRRNEVLDCEVYALAALRIAVTAPMLSRAAATADTPLPGPPIPDPAIPQVEVPPVLEPPKPPVRRAPIIVGRIRFGGPR